jgi:hypothetical protein
MFDIAFEDVLDVRHTQCPTLCFWVHLMFIITFAGVLVVRSCLLEST